MYETKLNKIIAREVERAKRTQLGQLSYIFDLYIKEVKPSEDGKSLEWGDLRLIHRASEKPPKGFKPWVDEILNGWQEYERWHRIVRKAVTDTAGPIIGCA